MDNKTQLKTFKQLMSSQRHDFVLVKESDTDGIYIYNERPPMIPGTMVEYVAALVRFLTAVSWYVTTCNDNPAIRVFICVGDS